MLQTHARKYNIPIDHLKLDFKVTDVVLDQEDIETAHKEAGREVYLIEIFTFMKNRFQLQSTNHQF